MSATTYFGRFEIRFTKVNKWFAYVHEGYTKHRCTQSSCLQGLAVGRVERYPL